MEFVAMLVLMAVVGGLILWPLLRGSAGAPAAGAEAGAAAPAARSRTALNAIKELEFDYATGKLAEDDYRILRARYEAKAIQALGEQQPAAPTMDEQLEAEIRAARARRVCASCGGGLPNAARFCPACGTAVEVRR